MPARLTIWAAPDDSRARSVLPARIEGEGRAMEPVWLKSYAEGIPAAVNVDEFRSIGEVFDRSAKKFMDRAAFVNMGTAITYAELDRLSRDFAAYLQGALKLERGARIALMMPNLLQYPVAMFGALRAGYTVVNTNPLYRPRELE